MTVDLEAIARRTNSELTSLKIALPLLEQGYAPPFLARYRRDELGGLGEHAMWALYRAMREDAWIRNRRDDLIQRLEQLPQVDPAIARAVRSAGSKRVIDRLARRVRSESGEAASPNKRLAARILSPEKGDPGDVPALATLMGLPLDAVDNASAVDAALISRLAIHPQMQATAVRWLFNNAKIRIVSVSDTHADPGAESATDESAGGSGAQEELTDAGVPSSAPSENGGQIANASEQPDRELRSPESAESATTAGSTVAGDESIAAGEQDANQELEQEDTETAWPTPEELARQIASTAEMTAVPTEASSPDAGAESAESVGAASSADPSAAAESPGVEPPAAPGKAKSKQKGKAKAAAKVKELKTVKKVSPRQRRRRWLVSVLQPLAGKEILAQRLTAFQTLMIGRGLRTGVVQCQFVYDTLKLTEQLLRTAAGLNEAFAPKLRELVAANDSVIREAAEAAWWDELLESSATRLVNVAADHLESQINHGGVDAKVVLSVDAMGPRTAAVAVVAADGRLLHTEDIACQLTAGMRSAAVTRMGELIHQFGVDLIVVSNGPARRGCLVILHELVEQSTRGSIRWTIAERSGADVYAGSELANREMRSTPRRFRSAAWLAFSVLRPSQAITKVDPMRLRLGSFQRELSDDALWPALRDVMTSGVSRGGVDVNSAPVDWLCQLPGLNRELATAIDKRRRQSLFTSRMELLSLEQWTDPVSARQAIPFLRVFGSEETLDGTLIHPDDYALAKKLATALKLELPPASPPGYRPPNFDEPAPAPASESTAPQSVVEEISVASSAVVENFAADLQPLGEGQTSGQDSTGEEPTAEESTGEQPPAEDASEQATSENQALTASDETPSAPGGDSEAAPVETAMEPMEATGEAAGADGASAQSAVDVPAAVRQPLPDEALINKCIKEWQVGARRVRHVVEALCNPFGEEDAAATGVSHAVMTKVPKVADLKVGDQVIGVIVGVTEFGAFVEMSPDCSGLVHVSRVADRFVEDLHEAVQVGDVITAWVTNVDPKRRRVGLSAISPEREMELERQRQERREESSQRGRYQGSRQRDDQRGGQQRGGQNRGGQARGGQGDSRSAASQGSDTRRSTQTAGAGQAGSHQAGGAPRGDSRGRDSRDSRDSRGARQDSRSGGRGGSGRGDARSGGQRGGRRDRDEGPTSYSTRVPRSDAPATPISEAMAKGDEPLRSFGDLMQFFKKADPAAVVKPQVVQQEGESKPAESSVAQPSQSEPQDQGTGHAPPTTPAAADAAAEGAAPES